MANALYIRAECVLCLRRTRCLHAAYMYCAKDILPPDRGMITDKIFNINV